MFCLSLTLVFPGMSLFQISHTIPALGSAHAARRILLLIVYFVVFTSLAIFSCITGLRLWLIKPRAVELAKRYLLTYLIAQLAFFLFWLALIRPKAPVALAEMAWYHVAGPLPFVALCYSYLEHSKRVRDTYGTV